MREPLVNPFEMRKGIPELSTANRIGKKKCAAFLPGFQDESSHEFLFV